MDVEVKCESEFSLDIDEYYITQSSEHEQQIETLVMGACYDLIGNGLLVDVNLSMYHRVDDCRYIFQVNVTWKEVKTVNIEESNVLQTQRKRISDSK